MIAATISGGLLFRQSQLSSDEKATEVFVLEVVLYKISVNLPDPRARDQHQRLVAGQI
jgi:hypothetical protein